MDIKRYKEEVSAVDWHKYGGSLYYEPNKVPTALLALAIADTESAEGIWKIEGMEPPNLLLNAKIKSDLLFAIGNNHSGAYYQAVQEALPFIIQVSLFGNHEVARNCAINILIDLYYFCPVSGSSEELLRFVKETIKRTVNDNEENFRQFSNDYSRNKSLVTDLFGIIDE